MTDLQTFHPVFPTNGYSLRVLLIDGEPWFMAVDVCGILGVGNAREAVRRLDDDEYQQVALSVISNDASDRNRKATLVSEPGLYGLVLGSRKADARLFKRWVKHEVLPEIRKTGSYAVPVDPAQQALAMAKALVAASEENLALREQAHLMSAVTSAQREELERVAPAVAAHAAYMDAEGLCTMATAAAALHIGRNSLFEELRRAGVLISTPGAAYNTPKARYKRVPHGLGWFEIKTGTRERSSGELEATYTTMVTSKGIEGIRRLLVL